MPQIVLNDTIVSVWSAGLQIQKGLSKTFYSKHAIATLSTVKTDKYCSLLYVPIHTQNQGCQEIVSWYSEKPMPNYADDAYEFIMSNLYSSFKIDDSIVGLYT